jgi:hypothetical protein
MKYGGFAGTKEGITLDEPAPLATAAWNEHARLLAATYPGRTFPPAVA